MLDNFEKKLDRMVNGAFAKADILVYGNAERQILDIARRLKSGESIGTIRDLRGTAFVSKRNPENWVEIDSTHLDTPGPLAPRVDPYAMTPTDIKNKKPDSLPFKGRDGVGMGSAGAPCGGVGRGRAACSPG